MTYPTYTLKISLACLNVVNGLVIAQAHIFVVHFKEGSLGNIRKKSPNLEEGERFWKGS